MGPISVSAQSPGAAASPQPPSAVVRHYTGAPHGAAYGLLKDWRSIMASHIPARTKFDNLLLTGQNLTVHGAIGVTLSAAATCSEIVGTEYLAKKIANA